MLGSTGSAVWGTGLVAPQRAGSFRTRDRTGVPRVAKQILNHWTTREGRLSILNITYVYLSIPNSQSIPSSHPPGLHFKGILSVWHINEGLLYQVLVT